MRGTGSDRFVNAVFAVCCVGLAGAGAMRYWPAAPAHVAREHVIQEGSPDPIGGSEGAHAGARMYVFVSSTCPACDASLPFYKRLSIEADRANASRRVVFAGLEPESAITAYLRRGGIQFARVLSVVRPAGVPGTPTIVAVDDMGRVERSWAGRLSPQQQRDVLAIAHGMLSAADVDTVEALLARVRARLRVSRDVASVTSIEADGIESSERGASTRTSPYEFTLRLPHTLRLRMGPILHILDAGVYSSRLVDGERYGGPMVDRIMKDPETIRAAAHGMQSHLMRLSLAYLAGTPVADQVEDEGVRDFGQVRGRTIVFRNTTEKARVELVVDVGTDQPLAVVTPIRTVGGPANGTDGISVSVLGSYRECGGIRVPFQIDDWAGTSHSRLTLTSVRVDGR